MAKQKIITLRTGANAVDMREMSVDWIKREAKKDTPTWACSTWIITYNQKCAIRNSGTSWDPTDDGIYIFYSDSPYNVTAIIVEK